MHTSDQENVLEGDNCGGEGERKSFFLKSCLFKQEFGC